MNWSILFLVIVLNSLFCFVLYLIEKFEEKTGKIPLRHSIIPDTNQKFLYWEDFYTQTYGDFLGLVWIVNGFVHLIVEEKIANWEWIIFLSFAILMMLVFVKSTLKSKSHKPDWGYPAEGKISLGGASHLPYFGALSSMALICLINMVGGDMKGVVLWTTLAGGIFYIATVIADIKTGHFDQLKLI